MEEDFRDGMNQVLRIAIVGGLENYMSRNGLTRLDLAARMNITNDALNRLMNGTRSIVPYRYFFCHMMNVPTNSFPRVNLRDLRVAGFVHVLNRRGRRNGTQTFGHPQIDAVRLFMLLNMSARADWQNALAPGLPQLGAYASDIWANSLLRARSIGHHHPEYNTPPDMPTGTQQQAQSLIHLAQVWWPAWAMLFQDPIFEI
jgi:transcriptional regulator with XRE-family HTH domain